MNDFDDSSTRKQQQQRCRTGMIDDGMDSDFVTKTDDCCVLMCIIIDHIIECVSKNVKRAARRARQFASGSRFVIAIRADVINK